MNRKARIREERTQLIIEQAEILFSEKGYNGTSTQDIADRTGLSKANIHYYFHTKKELYTAVLKDILSDWMHDGDIFDDCDDPKIALTAYIKKKMHNSFTRPNGSKVWAMEIIQGGSVFGDEIRKMLVEWDKKIIQRISKWKKEKKIADIDPQTLLNMIWATTQHYADFEFQIQTLNNNNPLSQQQRTQATDEICKIVLSGVLLGQ